MSKQTSDNPLAREPTAMEKTTIFNMRVSTLQWSVLFQGSNLSSIVLGESFLGSLAPWTTLSEEKFVTLASGRSYKM